MASDDFRQMCCNNRRWVNNGITQTLRLFSLSFCDPDRRKVEGRLKGRDTGNLFCNISGIHCHIMVKQDLSLCNLYAFDLNNILIRI